MDDTSKKPKADFTEIYKDWSRRSETFRLLGRDWNVDEAKQILIEDPRPTQYIYNDDLGSFITGFIAVRLDCIDKDIQRERDGEEPVYDLSVPVIMVTTTFDDIGMLLPIDGWHRIYKAYKLNVEKIPYVLLDKKESESVEY